MVSYIQEPHKLQAYPNLVLRLGYLLLHSDVLCPTADTLTEHFTEHQLQPTQATDGPDAVFHLIVSFCHMRMQVEKTEVMPEAPNCMSADPTVPEVSQLYINRSNDAHLYSLSLKQLEDAKKEIHKELSYPIRHTF